MARVPMLPGGCGRESDAVAHADHELAIKAASHDPVARSVGAVWRSTRCPIFARHFLRRLARSHFLSGTPRRHSDDRMEGSTGRADSLGHSRSMSFSTGRYVATTCWGAG